MNIEAYSLSIVPLEAYSFIGSQDEWCRAVMAACAEVGITIEVELVHHDTRYPWSEGGYRIVWPCDHVHEEWHAVHRALVLCEPLRRCRASEALERALRGERACGHPDCPIRESVES